MERFLEQVSEMGGVKFINFLFFKIMFKESIWSEILEFISCEITQKKWYILSVLTTTTKKVMIILD